MRIFSTVAALLTLSLAGSVIAAPSSLKTVERYRGAPTSGKYIVKLRDGVSRKSWMRRLRNNATAVDWDIINGIAADLTDDELNTLRASGDVETISEDVIMHTTALVTQTNAPWGLGRINQLYGLENKNANGLNFTLFHHDDAGQGVDIYIVDTGVFVNHNDFGGRARWGVSYVGTNTDLHGHGTHCAGTAAGTRWGVAKKANIIAVQVLNSAGNGPTSGIVSGLNWILAQARSSRRPSVVSMSLGGPVATSLDNAVAQLTAAGIHVVVAAGNENRNAGNYSPARAPSAITVGASTINDAKADYSNWGAAVDIFAPGSNVISATIDSTSATRSMSGTSMAAPHVAGIVASSITRDGNASPAAMKARVKDMSARTLLTGLPSGTINQLAQLQYAIWM